VEVKSGPEQINHRTRQRAITLQVTPALDMPLEAAMDQITTQVIAPLQASGQLQGGYNVNLAGTADKLRSTWRSLRWNLALAVLITYLLMAATFESWVYPFVVIATVPIGAVGGFMGLWLLNWYVLQPLDVLTMLGFIMLVGTVVNNPILIVEQSLIHLKEDGLPIGRRWWRASRPACGDLHDDARQRVELLRWCSLRAAAVPRHWVSFSAGY
jgi:HAE1 family hydrophobic/amphiphilic exporter-1